jgi:hypothetical protein
MVYEKEKAMRIIVLLLGFFGLFSRVCLADAIPAPILGLGNEERVCRLHQKILRCKEDIGFVAVNDPIHPIGLVVHHDSNCAWSEKRLKCWGDFSFELNVEKISDLRLSDQGVCWKIGELWKCHGQLQKNSLDEIQLSGIKDIEISEQHACRLTVAGEVECIGNNDHGQLAQAAILKMSTTWRKVSLGGQANALRVGGDTYCAQLKDQLIWKCWGRNSSGQAGIGSRQNAIFNPQPLMFIEVGEDKAVTDLVLSDNHSCAVAKNKLYCWGNNHFMQSDTASQHSPKEPVLSPRLIIPTVFSPDRVFLGMNMTCYIKDGSEHCF